MAGIRKIFHIMRRTRGGNDVFEVVDLRNIVRASRIRLRHAREVVLCLDRGHNPPSERRQFICALVRMSLIETGNSQKPFKIVTYKSKYYIRGFSKKWAARAWLHNYNEMRNAKLKAKPGSLEDKQVDIMVQKWLVSDNSASYGDLVEEAHRKLTGGA